MRVIDGDMLHFWPKNAFLPDVIWPLTPFARELNIRQARTPWSRLQQVS
jgi:hypothetical protein